MMGAGVSAGENNDDLIDNLIEANYIKTSLIERVFRAVDRGAYFLPEPPADAYRDVAWKNGNFHISAPCIYSEVLEALKLKPGKSFLNLGSGTGYLNTIAGLILGSYGINHGIELHGEVIQYAYMRLEEFKRHSGAVDEYDFCEPKFMRGNCLCLASGFHLYDRVYCGAACPEKYVEYIKNLVKVGGVLVVPINERLVEMRRVSEVVWTTHYLLPVSFINLVKPEGTEEGVEPFDIEPLSLQELCRTTIRNLLRKNIETENPNVKYTNVLKKRKTSKKKKTVKRDRNGRREAPRSSEELLDFFLLTVARKKKRINLAAAEGRANSVNIQESDEASTDSEDSSLEYPTAETIQKTLRRLDSRRPRENHASTSSNSQDNDAEEAGGSRQNDKAIVHRENNPETESPDQTVSYNITVEPMVVEEQIPEESRNEKSDNKKSFDEILISELASSSSDDDQDNKRCKRGLKEKEMRLNSKWRKIDRIDAPKKCGSGESTDNEDKSDSESEYVEAMRQMKMYVSPYSVHMKSKIQLLPLPSNVKKFLNFYRDF